MLNQTNMEKFNSFITGLVFSIIGILFGGYVSMKLWNWFLPVIFQVKSINFIEAIALCFIVGYFTTTKLSEEDDRIFSEKLIYVFVYYAIVLLLGWIISKFL